MPSQHIPPNKFARAGYTPLRALPPPPRDPILATHSTGPSSTPLSPCLSWASALGSSSRFPPASAVDAFLAREKLRAIEIRLSSFPPPSLPRLGKRKTRWILDSSHNFPSHGTLASPYGRSPFPPAPRADDLNIIIVLSCIASATALGEPCLSRASCAQDLRPSPLLPTLAPVPI